MVWRSLPRNNIPPLLDLLVSLLLIGPFISLLRKRFTQARARSAEQEIADAGSRRPVLYLRSFEHDRYTRRTPLLNYILTVPLPTLEQRVVNVLQSYGPVIAIGRPNERLPELGAARFYVDDEHWREKVADMARVSQFVLCMNGLTEGVKWELSHLIQHYPPQQLILWAHPWLYPGGAADRELQWVNFRPSLGSLFSQPLPERLGETRFIHFDSQFTAIPVVHHAIIGKGFYEKALNEFLNAKGAKPQPRRRHGRFSRGALLKIFAGGAAVVALVGGLLTPPLCRGNLSGAYCMTNQCAPSRGIREKWARLRSRGTINI
jgi:hypothetical protein